MDKTTKTIIWIVIAIVAAPIVLIILSLIAFIAQDFYYSTR